MAKAMGDMTPRLEKLQALAAREAPGVTVVKFDLWDHRHVLSIKLLREGKEFVLVIPGDGALPYGWADDPAVLASVATALRIAKIVHEEA